MLLTLNELREDSVLLRSLLPLIMIVFVVCWIRTDLDKKGSSFRGETLVDTLCRDVVDGFGEAVE